MQTQDTSAAPTPAGLYLIDHQLIAYFKQAGTPLPFCRSRLIQDRQDGCLGGVPYRQLGSKSLYNPDEVSRFLVGLPIIQAKPPKTAKTGRPSAAESAEAHRRGITVQQLRGGAA